MKTTYQDHADLKRIQKQWHKLNGLHSREEWSAAIVRAATAAELAANFAIRTEFEERSEFDSDFVDTLLRWSNGLAGKTDRLLIPLSAYQKKKKNALKTLKTLSEKINAKRNSIAHQGEFCNAAEAKTIIQHTRTFIETLVQLYEPDFVLKDHK
jgi:hypothetical protein